MAAIEGVRRIKGLGKWIIIIGSIAAVVLWVVAMLFYQPKINPVAQLIAFLLPPLILGGLIWIFGWIIEGFTMEPPA
jgi:hypothetical protein